MLTGTLGYFFVTYLFYLVMGMFNQMYLVYVILLDLSFFAFILLMLQFNIANIKSYFNEKVPTKLVGGFLIFNAVAIAFLWLGIVVPPLIQVYIVFLSILMTALTAKIIAMSMMGANVFPVIIVIPLFNLIAVSCAVLIMKSVSFRNHL